MLLHYFTNLVWHIIQRDEFASDRKIVLTSHFQDGGFTAEPSRKKPVAICPDFKTRLQAVDVPRAGCGVNSTGRSHTLYPRHFESSLVVLNCRLACARTTVIYFQGGADAVTKPHRCVHRRNSACWALVKFSSIWSSTRRTCRVSDSSPQRVRMMSNKTCQSAGSAR